LEQLAHVTKLNGHSIVRWVGTEMALAEGATNGGTVIWTHPDVAYLQLINLDVQLEDGRVYRMLAQSDDGTGYYGLYLVRREQGETLSSLECGSIYRTREIMELPVGQANVVVTESDGGNAVLRIEIAVGGHTVSCWAAEVYEREGGKFEVVQKDESILVQVDGKRPS
jgi:hypothetical protein